jgi:hypothetical protein
MKIDQISQQTSTQKQELDSYDKGYAFEQFIISLFNEKKFVLKKWRCSKKITRWFDFLDASYPDLEMVFTGRKKYLFAVECKWQSKFRDGKLFWAKSHQIPKYERFQRKYGIPVFIAIGVGGEPGNPEKLFVTPLQNISGSIEVFEHELMRYERKPNHRFFYDTVQLKLF